MSGRGVKGVRDIISLLVCEASKTSIRLCRGGGGEGLMDFQCS